METAEKKVSKKDSLIAELKEALRKANAENGTLGNKLAEMEKMMNLLMMKVNDSNPSENDEDEAVVVSRNFMKTALQSPDGSVFVEFRTGEQKYIPAEDMRLILKENSVRKNKQLFEKGLYYFKNPEDYKRFKITPRKDLSYEHVKDIITTENIDDMIAQFDEITNNGRDRAVTHVFAFEIVEMLKDREVPLRNWRYENRVALETRIGRKFDDLIAESCYFDLLRNE